ncbi:MAG: type II toxin-antitoxin system RelB/DinJ family antitoxin [candidate division KSB1 bacterium]|nr:type II toxin-antitoxin system RelB/DinJ family antitoxin [candidate division KSB1 bacterium]MDZ7300783.1 type II toxin-antitoxin system RelB/DinJ family antitoxin [candidate division KSB1 bacterium]MDZ7309946.1 type II toxin-antitoxin system RelB/DinJ family antitoxin [candidate division KSB1 bacterium]
MPKETQINIQMESQLRDEAEKIFKRLGFSFSEAVNIFLRQVVRQKGFPFDVKIPNEETIRAFGETERNKDGLPTYDSPEKLFAEMDKW